MELNPFAWVYFVSFVIVGTFVVVNLFIAVVINNLDRAKEEALKDLEPAASRGELLRELRSTQTVCAVWRRGSRISAKTFHRRNDRHSWRLTIYSFEPL